MSFNNDECFQCKKHKEYEKYLISKRKFTKGELISTIDDLLNQEWVMWHNKPTHITVIKHLQLWVVLNLLETKCICKAIRKESEEE